MWTWQKHNQIIDLVKTGTCWNITHEGMFTSSMHSPRCKSWQDKHTSLKKAQNASYTWQEQWHSMHGSTTITSAKSQTSWQSAQIRNAAKVELDWLKLGCSIIANKGMDGYSTTRLTKHPYWSSSKEARITRKQHEHMASWTKQSQDLVKSLSPWKQIYRVPHFASLHKSPHRS